MIDKCIQCGGEYLKVKPWQKFCQPKCKSKFNNKYDKEYAREYAQTPVARYNSQKQTSKRRGIIFDLTFEEWWAYWEPHWELRGRGKGCLVMSRFGDSGNYVVGNVFINTYEENSKEAADGQQQERSIDTGRFISEDD